MGHTIQRGYMPHLPETGQGLMNPRCAEAIRTDNKSLCLTCTLPPEECNGTSHRPVVHQPQLALSQERAERKRQALERKRQALELYSKGLSRRQIAALLKCHKTTLSKWLTGH